MLLGNRGLLAISDELPSPTSGSFEAGQVHQWRQPNGANLLTDTTSGRPRTGSACAYLQVGNTTALLTFEINRLMAGKLARLTIFHRAATTTSINRQALIEVDANRDGSFETSTSILNVTNGTTTYQSATGTLQLPSAGIMRFRLFTSIASGSARALFDDWSITFT